ncbi:hypothetical protein ABB37_03864 [Leptomonas pyrrhocoris]|uniref:PSP1 C-terminal domain-containing protein n=1 Tax=Leptomonas pyrrhocoris TaxID=157538 RepID=A0A0M9G3I9_LEPPY|nr:hypothetical protein ABB37_03864 [Leptomonas pyrrhocoris]KPA81513.1 hypothetical protein ABB37_03864 [Leptomonas pyrrhocoris]|eukprot:XP_015659952.1 hypothetical protein ABB37_03864 [Leptomonas pyrrhocoris]
MPPTMSNQTMEKEQLASIVRRLMIDADDFFIQQQKTLQLSYAELNSRIDQLRRRVQHHQQQQQMPQVSAMSANNGLYSNTNPSPFSMTHNLPNADMLGTSGTGQSVLCGGGSGSMNVNATPLRTTSGGSQGYGTTNSAVNNGASRSLLDSLNGPSALLAMSDAALESGRLNSATGGTGGGGGGFMSRATATNGSALTSGGRGAYKVEAITPPNKQLALSQSTSKSPSMSQQQQHQLHAAAGLINGVAVYDDPITGEYTCTAQSNPNASSSRHDSLMASPQTTEKFSLEEFIGRFNTTTASVNAASTAFNFDSLYEQLTSGGPEESSQSPLDYTDNLVGPEKYTAHAASPYDRSSGGGVTDRDGTSPDANAFGGVTAKNSIPVDSLRAVHDQHLTTSVRVTYEQGRPKVRRIPGGAADTPESLGINPRSSCEVLVEFKRKRVLQYESHEYVAPGSYVIVGGDRGEDLGLVVYAWCEVSLEGSKSGSSSSGIFGASEHNISGAGKQKVVGVGLTDSKLPRSMGVGNGTVLRLASDVDVQQLLGTQVELERRAIDVCAQLVLDHSLPMVIVDAEYQFDKKKLTFFYEAQQRMDFRELVRHLYKTFRARIWMELVDA